MRCFDHGGDIYDKPHVRIDFSANINPLGFPPGVLEALTQQAEGFQRYPDPHCRALRGVLAKRHGLRPEQVLCGNGAADLIFRLCACLRPKIALVTAPTFSEYERAVLVHGGRVREYLLREERQFDVDTQLLDMMTQDVELVFLCSPNNPTGRLIDPELIIAAAERCQAQGSYLVLDECFIDFTTGPSMVQMLEKLPHLLVLRAFTKMYAMAGLRLGYLLSADEALLQRISPFGAPWSVSGPAQAAGLAALNEPNWAQKTRAFVQRERAHLKERLTTLGLTVFPGEANYLLIKHDRPLYQPLLQRGILVRDCGNYTGLSSCFIRVSVQNRERNAQLLAALQEVLHG